MLLSGLETPVVCAWPLYFELQCCIPDFSHGQGGGLSEKFLPSQNGKRWPWFFHISLIPPVIPKTDV